MIWRWLFPKRCKHEWLVGKPTNHYSDCDKKYPAVCRWCNARKTLSYHSAHIWKEWQRLELERLKFPAGEPLESKR
jgi:hypothetical protein